MIKLKFDYFFFYFALLFCMLAWNPASLYSERMELNTYYPAPYARYVNLLTRENTYLAQGNGASVYIGSNPIVLSSSNGGNIYLPGANPEINFLTSPNNIHLKAGITPVTKKNSFPRISIDSDMFIQGAIKRVCKLYEYTDKGTDDNSNITYCGSNIHKVVNPEKDTRKIKTDSFRYTIFGVEEWHSPKEISMGFPSRGKMLCCRVAYN